MWGWLGAWYFSAALVDLWALGRRRKRIRRVRRVIKPRQYHIHLHIGA